MAPAIVMPSYGMYTAEGTLVRWLRNSGERVEAGEVVAEIETDKALAEVTSPASGILHHAVEPGAQLEVESLIGWVLDPGEAPPSAERPRTPEYGGPEPPPAAPPMVGDRVVASPNARRLAAELGIDLANVTGTGPGGRIGEADVRAIAEGRA